MTYTASQNSKTRTTHTAAALFAILILVAGIAALAMHPAEAFAKPLCTGNGPCYASVNTNANAADNVHSLCNSMACMRSAIEGRLCVQRCLSGNGAAFIDENGNGICDNYENGLCPGNGLGYGNPKWQRLWIRQRQWLRSLRQRRRLRLHPRQQPRRLQRLRRRLPARPKFPQPLNGIDSRNARTNE